KDPFDSPPFFSPRTAAAGGKGPGLGVYTQTECGPRSAWRRRRPWVLPTFAAAGMVGGRGARRSQRWEAVEASWPAHGQENMH
uniref:Uncharacterized protein n=1 Tax=Sus scrofa TaxID=9823 RepID=A0A4X1TNQ7_PIG